MKNIDGRTHQTISDAAAELGVSVSSIRRYIELGILPEPPEIPFGMGTIMVFPESYLENAKPILADQREAKAEQKRRRSRRG